MNRHMANRDIPRPGRTGRRLLLFPGLDAVLVPAKMQRWLDVPKVVSVMAEVSGVLSGITGKNEDLLAVFRSMRRPHEIDQDRVLIGLIAIQVAISRLVESQVDIDIVTGCSHGDMARLVFSDCVGLDEMIRLAWVSGRARLLCEPGLNASARSIHGRLSEEQLEWMDSFPVSVSHWTHHHATVSGGEDVMRSMMAKAPDHGIKMHKLLPVAIHSRVMAPAVERSLAYASSISVHPPRHPIFSSVYADFVATPDQLRREAADAASSSIHWMKTIKRLKDEIGVREVVCIGPSSTLIDWMADDAEYQCISTVDAWDLYKARTETEAAGEIR